MSKKLVWNILYECQSNPITDFFLCSSHNTCKTRQPIKQFAPKLPVLIPLWEGVGVWLWNGGKGGARPLHLARAHIQKQIHTHTHLNGSFVSAPFCQRTRTPQKLIDIQLVGFPSACPLFRFPTASFPRFPPPLLAACGLDLLLHDTL